MTAAFQWPIEKRRKGGGERGGGQDLGAQRSWRRVQGQVWENMKDQENKELQMSQLFSLLNDKVSLLGSFPSCKACTFVFYCGWVSLVLMSCISH